MKTKKWKMKDGNSIAIKDMKTDHIKNALNMLYKNGFIGEDTYNFYLYTDGPTGEAAQLCFEQELKQVLRRKPNIFIDLFKQELENRSNIIQE
jgi:hypothetical protein